MCGNRSLPPGYWLRRKYYGFLMTYEAHACQALGLPAKTRWRIIVLFPQSLQRTNGCCRGSGTLLELMYDEQHGDSA